MIDAVTLLSRKPGMTVEAFQRYWRHEHAAVIARLPGVERYVQSHPLAETYQGSNPVCDGIAELWARDSQAFREIGKSTAYVAVQADEERFLDRTRIALVLTEEHVIEDGPVTTRGVKCIRLLKRKAGVTVEAFRDCWLGRYGPQVASLPALERYVQCHARRSAYADGRQPAYDGFDITWFASIDAQRRAMQSTAQDRASEIARDFLASDGCAQILAMEHVIIS